MSHYNFTRLVTYRERGWIEAESKEKAAEILRDPEWLLNGDAGDGDCTDNDVAGDIDDVEIESIDEMEDTR